MDGDAARGRLNYRKSFKDLKWYEWVMIAAMILIAARSMVLAFTDSAAESNPPWLTVINFMSAICGIFCIFFTAKAHITNFIFAIVNTVTYAIYLRYWKIYGTLFLELLFYLPTEIISWIAWTKHRDGNNFNRTVARKLTSVQNILIAASVAATGIVYHAVLTSVGGNVAWFDAYTVSIGIVATLLELGRYREQYIWWLITDFVAVGMFVIHFDAVYLTKKIIYLIMAVIGLINWIKLSRENHENT